MATAELHMIRYSHCNLLLQPTNCIRDTTFVAAAALKDAMKIGNSEYTQSVHVSGGRQQCTVTTLPTEGVFEASQDKSVITCAVEDCEVVG